MPKLWNKGWLNDVALDVMTGACLADSFPPFSMDVGEVDVMLSRLNVWELSSLQKKKEAITLDFMKFDENFSKID